MEFFVGLLIVLVIIAIFALSCVKVVAQSKAYVVERLGKYSGTWDTGLHFKVPFIERIAKIVSLKEQVVDFAPQAVITKDNVTMKIDTVVFFQITDPKLYCYGVEAPLAAIENLTATTLRNIIGEMDLDETLTSRDTINTKIRSILDEATDPWGIKVNRVELKNILPPKEIQDSMEKQMKAERERREAILRAEGDKQSRILEAQGFKESKILEAEAEKQSAILRADAVREQKIIKRIEAVVLTVLYADERRRFLGLFYAPIESRLIVLRRGCRRRPLDGLFGLGRLDRLLGFYLLRRLRGRLFGLEFFVL